MTQAELEEKIRSIEEQIQQAPSSLSEMKTNPSDGKLVVDSEGNQILDVFADLGETRFANLRIINNIPEKNVTCVFSQQLDFIKENEYSEQEATEYANSILQQLGIQDMGIIKSYFDGNFQTYNFTYTRLFEEIPVYNLSGKSGSDSQAYSVPWDHEKIDITIGANGITRFEWTSPYEIKEKITDNANLLSFPEIRQKIEDVFFTYYNEDSEFGENPPTDITYTVENLQLCLMRIEEKDSSDGLIIPVWLVCGKDYGNSETFHGINIAATSELLLIINAIDGSLF